MSRLLKLSPLSGFVGLLLATSAQADSFVSATAPGMCLGESNGVAAIWSCSSRTKVNFGGYGQITLQSNTSLCLTSLRNPSRGASLVWRFCQDRRGGGGACNRVPEQCWGYTASTGVINNEAGYRVDLEGASKAQGARVIASTAPVSTQQRWVFGNLMPVNQAAQHLGLNSVGLAQLKALDQAVAGKLDRFNGSNVVAGGAGNIIAAGGGNMVAAGGGNIIAAGGGNIIAAGGGNIVAAGGGNVVPTNAGNLINPSGAALTLLGGGSNYISSVSRLVGNDGASLQTSLASYFTKVNGLSFAEAAASMVAAGGGNIVAAGGGNIIAAGGGNFVALAQAGFVNDLFRGMTGLSGTRSLMSNELPASLHPDLVAAFERLKGRAQPVLTRYEQMLASGKNIPQSVRDQAGSLKSTLLRLLTRNQPLSSGEEQTIVSAIQSIDSALAAAQSAPVTPPPPPPPAPVKPPVPTPPVVTPPAPPKPPVVTPPAPPVMTPPPPPKPPVPTPPAPTPPAPKPPVVTPPAPKPVVPPPAPPKVSIRSGHAPGKCLDVASGQGILLWDCHGGSNQRFEQAADGSLRYNGQCLGHSGSTLRFESCYSGVPHQTWRVEGGALKNGNVPPKCIDIEQGSKNNGAKLLAWDCHGGSNQKWSLTP